MKPRWIPNWLLCNDPYCHHPNHPICDTAPIWFTAGFGIAAALFLAIMVLSQALLPLMAIGIVVAAGCLMALPIWLAELEFKHMSTREHQSIQIGDLTFTVITGDETHE